LLKATTHKKGCVGVSGKQGESDQVKQSGFEAFSGLAGFEICPRQSY